MTILTKADVAQALHDEVEMDLIEVTAIADKERKFIQGLRTTVDNTSDVTIDTYVRCDTGMGDYLHPGSWRDEKPEPPPEPEYIECEYCEMPHLRELKFGKVGVLVTRCQACGAPLPLEEKPNKKKMEYLGKSVAQSMRDLSKAFRELGYAAGGGKSVDLGELSELEPLANYPDPPKLPPIEGDPFRFPVLYLAMCLTALILAIYFLYSFLVH